MTVSRVFAVLSLGFALISAPASFAQTIDIGVPIDTTCTATSSTLEADTAAVDAALAAAQARGYSGLSQHINSLRAVADHAPSCYPEVRANGSAIIIRSESPQEYSALSLALLTAAAARGEVTTVEAERNVYPIALLYLGSHAVEFQRYDDAHRYLDRGLALQPDNQYFLLEKGAALGGQHRFAEAAELFQAMLDNPALSLTLDRARAYRSLGVALIDVPDRLDDAEAALRQSLTLEPGNQLAQSELQYIAQLRAGARQRPFELNAPMSERSNH